MSKKIPSGDAPSKSVRTWSKRPSRCGPSGNSNLKTGRNCNSYVKSLEDMYIIYIYMSYMICNIYIDR